MVGFEKEGKALSARGRSFTTCWWRPDDGALRAGLIVSRLWAWASGRGGRKVERRYPRNGDSASRDRKTIGPIVPLAILYSYES